jgi:hypothetical protein
VLLAGLVLAPIPATAVGERYMIQRGLFILPFAIVIAAFGLARLRESSSRLIRTAAMLVLPVMILQFGYVYYDYRTHYKYRSAFYYDPVAFVDVAAFLVAPPTPPAFYLHADLDDAGAKWRFYTTKNGRTDLLARTHYFLGDGLELAGAQPGSLLVMYIDRQRLAALERTRQWEIVRVITDVDGRETAAILRKVG